MKHFLGIIILFIGITILAIGYFQRLPTTKIHTPINPLTTEQKGIMPSSVPASRSPFFSAEIDVAEEANALLSLSSAGGILKEVLPSWHVINTSGNILLLDSDYVAEIKQLASESGINIIPSIRITWRLEGEHPLSTTEKQIQMAKKILLLVQKEQYQGINIDIKNAPDDIQSRLQIMTETISGELTTKNKKFYFTVNQTRYDGSNGLTVVLPFSEKLQQNIKDSMKKNIYNFSFQFLGSENPNVWSILDTVK